MVSFFVGILKDLFDKFFYRWYNLHVLNRTEVKIMDFNQIVDFVKNIPWDDIIKAVKDVVAMIEKSGIIDKVVAAVSDVVKMIGA